MTFIENIYSLLEGCTFLEGMILLISLLALWCIMHYTFERSFDSVSKWFRARKPATPPPFDKSGSMTTNIGVRPKNIHIDWYVSPNGEIRDRLTDENGSMP